MAAIATSPPIAPPTIPPIGKLLLEVDVVLVALVDEDEGLLVRDCSGTKVGVVCVEGVVLVVVLVVVLIDVTDVVGATTVVTVTDAGAG